MRRGQSMSLYYDKSVNQRNPYSLARRSAEAVVAKRGMVGRKCRRWSVRAHQLASPLWWFYCDIGSR
jgi:hypothetical protein